MQRKMSKKSNEAQKIDEKSAKWVKEKPDIYISGDTEYFHKIGAEHCGKRLYRKAEIQAMSLDEYLNWAAKQEPEKINMGVLFEGEKTVLGECHGKSDSQG